MLGRAALRLCIWRQIFRALSLIKAAAEPFCWASMIMNSRIAEGFQGLIQFDTIFTHISIIGPLSNVCQEIAGVSPARHIGYGGFESGRCVVLFRYCEP